MPSSMIRLLLLRDDNYTHSTIDYDCTVACFVASGAHTYTFAPALVTAISIFFFLRWLFFTFIFSLFYTICRGYTQTWYYFFFAQILHNHSLAPEGGGLIFHVILLRWSQARCIFFFFAFLLFWVDAITYNLHDSKLFSLHKFSMHTSMCDGASEPIF